ncbi:hypothetical protein HID58_076835 [Brassica napus]|uniref:Uncharacterized protein n=1 Tax=Brassica napus TaxID=3708 RepID=A0ABQ7YNW1_BRANA|nr:hypothetical protein HID58_076835 [Brassica napus]
MIQTRSPGVRRNAKRLVNGPRETRTLDGEASIVGIDQEEKTVGGDEVWNNPRDWSCFDNQHDEIEAKFFEESQRAALEAKYQKLYQPFYTKRYEIVTGVVEVEGAPEEIPEMKALLSILRISSGAALKNQKVLSRTEIEWFPGKCLTRRILKKKPNKGSKNTKPITKTEDCESFFTFLSPPQVSDDEEDLDDDMNALT